MMLTLQVKQSKIKCELFQRIQTLRLGLNYAFSKLYDMKSQLDYWLFSGWTNKRYKNYHFGSQETFLLNRIR